MALTTLERFGFNDPSSNVFSVLDELYALNPPSADELRTFGQYAITNAQILETPKHVLDCGEALTNPSQIEEVQTIIDGVKTLCRFAYFRQEPTTLHLGKTKAAPYLIKKDAKGNPYLEEFEGALTLPGEDPRIMPGVNMKSPSGKVHKGWTVSTVVATPKPDNPADAQSIKQVIYWGKTLKELEPVAEIPDLKNACLYPVARASGDDKDTRIHLFGRPHPDITYSRVKSLHAITKDVIEAGQNLTKNFLPDGIRTGVNTVNKVPGNPRYLNLDAHEGIHKAREDITTPGKTLHYRLVRYGFDLLTKRVIFLGVSAKRSDFPFAEPKPPENDVLNYMDILYGSMGHVGQMVTGVSDRHVGIADVVQVNA